MFHIYLSLAQEQRELQAIEEFDFQIDPNAQMYAEGEFDAIIGAEPNPELITNSFYWSGYQSRQYQYYCQKYGIKLETEF